MTSATTSSAIKNDSAVHRASPEVLVLPYDAVPTTSSRGDLGDVRVRSESAAHTLKRNSTEFRYKPTSAGADRRGVGLTTGQPMTEHTDPLVEGVEVRVMTSPSQVDSVGLGSPTDQFVLGRG